MTLAVSAPARLGACAVALGLAVTAVCHVAAPRAHEDPAREALRATLSAREAQHRAMARELARSARAETFARDLAHAPPDLRSAQLVDARGSVRASVEPAREAPRCAVRVVDAASDEGGRVVLALDDLCEARAALAVTPAPARASAWWAGMILSLLGGAAVWEWARRARDAEAARVEALCAAAAKLGAGERGVRVPLRGDAFDPLATALHEMADEMALSAERVEYLQRLAGWQDVARKLAHEIKNPLTPIQLAVQEVARRYQGDDARFQRALDTAREVVEEEVATLRRLVTAFSEFARLPDVKPTAADLGEFVRDTATSQAFLDEAAGDEARAVSVHYDCDEGAIPVLLDRIMLKRALENLVRNATQALAGRGGNVWVRAQRRRVTIVPHEGAAPEEVDQAWLTVEDDGPGIPAAQRAKVFDPYFTTKREGTGLGLAIVRKIALDHAGDVGLEERPGGGARFVVTLPLRDPARRARRSFVTFTRNG